jgi:hypothetical protein
LIATMHAVLGKQMVGTAHPTNWIPAFTGMTEENRRHPNVRNQ